MTRRFVRSVLIAASLLQPACTRVSDATARFQFELRARSDDGDPLAGALVAIGTQKLGTTDERGLLERAISGSEGQTLLAKVTCPMGYDGPKDPLSVRLTRTRGVNAAGPRPTRVDVTCKRKTRKIVVAVRAPDGAHLPVLVEGIAATTVNADGSAHVLVEVDEGVRSLAVTIDTSDRQELVPKNPRRLFELDGGDALLVMEQGFRMQTPRKRVEQREARPRRHVPTRVD